MSKIITITSCKGGTGKTINTLNLAATYSKMNKKVLIIDLDFYSNAISTILNLEIDKDFYTLAEDIKNNKVDDINKYIIKYKENIDILSSPKDLRTANKIDGKYLKQILSKLSSNYDIILIDTNYFLNDINLFALDLSDKMLYIINNDPVCLKTIKSMITIYNDLSKGNYEIVLDNSINNLKSDFTTSYIKNFIGYDIKYIIPHTFHINNIYEYIKNGKILLLDSIIRKKHKKVVNIYEKLATDLISKETL